MVSNALNRKAVMKPNLNTLAKEVARREGKKINLSIAQIKEVIRHMLAVLATVDYLDVMIVLQRYRRKRKP
jgi:hypothetical protein